jgi:(1->4)-alpha-D-glucan 1-alpha-D-glucosylmutase
VTPPRTPTGTYRVQFGRSFTFADAEHLVPYLAALGVSHLYASSYLKARAGSTHGYDLTDYGALNPEIGDEDGLVRLCAALDRHGMGQILDFIPNHMGIGKADNVWWLDVLEWGQASPYAEYFDIDWTPAKEQLRGKVLLPALGGLYGEVLERGELAVAFDPAAGSFGVWYHEHLFPIRPAHYGAILAPYIASRRAAGEADGVVLDALDGVVKRAPELRVGRLPIRRRAAVREAAILFKRDLAALVARCPESGAAIEAAVEAFNGTPGDARSFQPLHRLLERQAYRLAYWRVAADEINYRRFFDINDLAGVRMERTALFEVAHRLVQPWVAQGRLHGRRIDHIDGRYDPAQYCRRLTAQASEALAPTAPAEARPKLYLVVEKILAQHEALRDWPIDGTTGYEMLNLINGLFVDPDSAAALDAAYRQFLGRGSSFDEILYAAKKLVMRTMLASELQVLANTLDRICETNWRTRDFTLAGLRAALEEVVANFPVYRTYVDERAVTAADRRDIDWAVGLARRRRDADESPVLDFIHGVLTGDLVRRRRSGYSRRAVIDVAKRFQQFTGPVTAKSLEDTSFYRFNRLLSLNEVGGDPRRVGASIAAFHHVNQERMRLWPTAMTTTATHDTKRGEDMRARLDVLSEMPREWGARARHWATLNRRAKFGGDGASIPGRNDEYFLYQTLVGAWPNALMDAAALDPAALDAFRERIEGCMLKSMREAKLRTSWAHPKPVYEDAMTAFIRRVLDPAASQLFLADLVGFAARLAGPGMVNGLAQTVLKLTVPGVPDVYQGAELWDLSLVDPDNRRPVDFARRATLLGDLAREFPPDRAAEPAALRRLLDCWPDGRIKLFVLWRLLTLRRGQEELFRRGAYVPLAVEGRHEEHICAFARVADEAMLLVAVPRLTAKLGAAAPGPLGALWGDTKVVCPERAAGRPWLDVFSGKHRHADERMGGPVMPAARLFAELPIAVMVAGSTDGGAG